MLVADQEIIDKYKIKGRDRVLDVGGSMDQHKHIKVDTLVDIIRPEDAPYGPSKLRAKNFVKVDITKDRLPFKDKEFDFCLCTHTLEDLYNPFLVLSEMQRVAKRGLIVTPSMGHDMVYTHVDITDWLTGVRRLPGEAHHKWFFQKTGINTVHIIPKVYPVLYTSDFHITEYKGEPEFIFYWKDKFKVLEEMSLNIHELIEVYRGFLNKNKKLIKKGTTLFYLDEPTYYLKAFVKKIFKLGEGFKMRKILNNSKF
jgi:hypothetical protein